MLPDGSYYLLRRGERLPSGGMQAHDYEQVATCYMYNNVDDLTPGVSITAPAARQGNMQNLAAILLWALALIVSLGQRLPP